MASSRTSPRPSFGGFGFRLPPNLLGLTPSGSVRLERDVRLGSVALYQQVVGLRLQAGLVAHSPVLFGFRQYPPTLETPGAPG